MTTTLLALIIATVLLAILVVAMVWWLWKTYEPAVEDPTPPPVSQNLTDSQRKTLPVHPDCFDSWADGGKPCATCATTLPGVRT